MGSITRGCGSRAHVFHPAAARSVYNISEPDVYALTQCVAVANPSGGDTVGLIVALLPSGTTQAGALVVDVATAAGPAFAIFDAATGVPLVAQQPYPWGLAAASTTVALMPAPDGSTVWALHAGGGGGTLGVMKATGAAVADTMTPSGGVPGGGQPVAVGVAAALSGDGATAYVVLQAADASTLLAPASLAGSQLAFTGLYAPPDEASFLVVGPTPGQLLTMGAGPAQGAAGNATLTIWVGLAA